MSQNKPQFPLYIPTKGRHQFMVTSRALTAMGVHHNLIVEPQEVDLYLAAIERDSLMADVVELDMAMKGEYETCDEYGLSKSTGSGPARNFAWRHAAEQGHNFHWIMDDNIKWFFRFNHNLKTPCRSPAFWRAMEDFVLRYENIAMAGPNYFMFAARKTKSPAFYMNTRIYSCNLIRNDVPFKWRGRYNEDTILSLDMLKAGWCTVLFNAFLQEKMVTQSLPGGNTSEIYLGEKVAGQKYAVGGTDEKSRMLEREHPDVARVAERFQRTHHIVDYSRFRQRLKLKPNVERMEGNNEYGMKLRKVEHYRAGF